MSGRTQRPLVPALRELDQRLATSPMPIGAKNRIAARIAQESQRRESSPVRRLLPMLTFAAGAALVFVVVGWRLLAPSQPDVSRPGAASFLGSFAIAGDDCHARPDGDFTWLDGDCRLVAPHLEVQTWSGARVMPWERGLQLAGGEATFDVAKVGPGEAPVRIAVSHGTIEVLGTRFAIDQDDYGGHVDLFEGRIRFVPSEAGAAAVEIEPGQRHAWGDRALPPRPTPQPRRIPEAAAEGATPPASGDESGGIEDEIEIEIDDADPRTARASRRGTDEEADAIAQMVTRLRAAGRYGEAARILRKALRRRWSGRTAQVFSYELGEILERHRGDRGAACRHWRQHAKRFPSGRYADAVERSLHACD